MCPVAAFDFDKTITNRDAFVPFLICVFGPLRVARAFLRLLPEAVRVGMKRSTRDIFKQRIVAHLFTNVPVFFVQAKVPGFAARVMRWVKPEARQRIAWHKAQGHRLILVSASLEVYLKPIARQLGFDDLLATRLAVGDKNHYTGKLIGNNCRAAEKVARLTECLGDLTQVDLYAYGDSEGDAEMLKAARHPFFRRLG